ncbi:hypothetical protein JOB18_044512 [Solea senegalensis]|uniref:Uncharacterized protein n=1 Tax=Solea senegalensis TaxID=28829 RepID=A0AAV6S7Y7_SOLSE|nr:hypothetical protein JOB18_044512 [Solea senegalensis]
MASSPLLFIWLSSQRKNSLVLPSVGINKGDLKPPATIQGSSMLTIKANPSRFLHVLLTTSKVKWQVRKEVLYPAQ